MDGLLAIAIDPCYISKAGKKTPHIGRFWSGCAGAVKHRLEIMGIGLLDVANNKCMMLRAHQTLGNSVLKMRNKTLVDYYISVMKQYSKKLLSITDIVVADAFFSTSTFEKGMSEFGFYLVSRFRDNACLHYIPKKEKGRGRPRVKGNKIDMANLNLSCMEELHIDGLEGKAYTLKAYAKALKKNGHRGNSRRIPPAPLSLASCKEPVADFVIYKTTQDDGNVCLLRCFINHKILPADQLRESMRSMGFTASRAMAGSTSTAGQPYFSALYTFLSVFFFIYSHSVQAQPLPPSVTSGGTGRKVWLGQVRCISWRIPASVATINSLTSG